MKTDRLHLRSPVSGDVYYLAAILSEPEVAEWWHGYDEERVRAELLDDGPESTVWVLEYDSDVIGAIVLAEELDPDYRHAGIDLFVSHAYAGQHLGSEAIVAIRDHAVHERGHHRVTVDPAETNERARNAYRRCGFSDVGVMQKYERGPDGEWRSGVLMEYVI